MVSDTMRPHLVTVGSEEIVSIPSQGSATVQAVLAYLSTMERSANLRNDRHAARHFQQCWLTVCDAYYGAPDVAPERICHTPNAGLEHRALERPRWFVEKFSRPLVQVIARVTERPRRAGVGAKLMQSFDVLACGHKLPARELLPGEKPAKHRRCKECGRK